MTISSLQEKATVRPANTSEDSAVWSGFFRQWPADLAQRGVIVTTYDEQIAFVGFMVGSHTLLIERQTPDSVGARKVVIPFNKINAIKITDPISADIFKQAGFTGAIAER